MAVSPSITGVGRLLAGGYFFLLLLDNKEAKDTATMQKVKNSIHVIAIYITPFHLINIKMEGKPPSNSS